MANSQPESVRDVQMNSSYDKSKGEKGTEGIHRAKGAKADRLTHYLSCTVNTSQSALCVYKADNVIHKRHVIPVM